MAAGLFELRKDAITGWWVATVVDRAFHRDRFALAGRARRRRRSTANCAEPPGDGVRARMLKDFAFHVVGTEAEARELDAVGSRRSRSPQARAPGSWRTVVAPPDEHRPLHAVGTDVDRGARSPARRDALAEARDAGQTDYLQVVQNWGAQAGARTNHLLPRPVRPAADPASRRRGAGRRGPVRHPRGRVPVLPARPRRDRARRTGSSGRTTTSVAFAPYASRSPFEVWVVPRRHEADFGRATRRRHRGDRRGAPPGARAARREPRRPAVQPRPPYRAAAEQVDATYHWHWEIHPRLREIAGPRARDRPAGNPVSPEDAVEELLGRADARRPSVDGTG